MATALASASSTNAYVYCGDLQYNGICLESYTALQARISEIFVVVRPLLAENFAPKAWNPHDLVVFPGGKCSSWDELLSPEQLSEFLAWFLKGGRVLGICAGAYYFSGKSTYQLSSDHKISRLRQAALFPGECRGPILKQKIMVVKVRWEESQKEGYVVAIGAGALVPDSSGDYAQAHHRVLARNLDVPEQDSVAVVSSRIQSGCAVLSTVHWEMEGKDLINARLMLSDANAMDFDSMVRKLDESVEFRRECLQAMMRELERVV